MSRLSFEDYHLEAPKSGMRVPRIFGMTASPVDVKVGVIEIIEYAHLPPLSLLFVYAYKDLEKLLHSCIAITAHSLQVTSKKPLKIKEEFEQPFQEYYTVLCKELMTKFRESQSLERLFAISKTATSTLGE